MIGGDRTSWQTLARRRWPDAAWIVGGGMFASVSHCRCVTVVLYESRADAVRAKAAIDRSACGGRCTRDHRVVNLARKAAAP